MFFRKNTLNARGNPKAVFRNLLKFNKKSSNVSTKSLGYKLTFVNNTGGGITLSNLFSTWDSTKLAVACSGYALTSDMDASICNNYYQLGWEERKWIFPFNLFRRKYFSGKVEFKAPTTTGAILKEKSKDRGKMIDTYLYPVLDFFGFSNFMVRTKLSSKFCRWLDEFSPHVIYAQASSLSDILFCLEVKKYTKKPLVFHMMDDWISTLNRNGSWQNIGIAKRTKCLGCYWKIPMLP